MSDATRDADNLSADDQLLAKLGYKQELSRSWSSFSNFAISFSIISILAGCFTTFGQAWNNGGPIAISLGWPLISIFILIIGLCMSELVSAYPTAGGIYWWAATMGKPVHGWFTGWLNLIGLIAVTASVDYGCATFASLVLDAYTSWDSTNLYLTFVLFAIILALHAVINIYGHNLIVWGSASIGQHKAKDSQDRALREYEKAVGEVEYWACKRAAISPSYRVEQDDCARYNGRRYVDVADFSVTRP